MREFRSAAAAVCLAICIVLACGALAAPGPDGDLVRLKGHTDTVLAVAISPDAATILTGSNDATAVLWDAKTGQALRRFAGHALGVTAVAFSGDGTRVVTGAMDHTARVWDAKTGELLANLKGQHRMHVHGVAISPDGKRVLTASCDQSVILWDVAAERALRRYPHDGEAFAVAFSPDGATFVSGSHGAGGAADKCLRLYDAKAGDPIEAFASDPVFGVAYVDGGRRVLVLGESVMKSLDVAGRKLTELRNLENVGRVDCFAATPDGARLLVGGVFEVPWIDLKKPEPLQSFRSRESNRAVAVAPDGTWGVIAAGGRNQPWGQGAQHYEPARDTAVRVVSLRGDFNPAVYLPDDPRRKTEMLGFAAVPDGSRVVCGFMDGSAVWFDASSGREAARVKEARAVTAIGISPDAALTALIVDRNTLTVYDRDAKPLGSTHPQTEDWLQAVCPAPDRTSVFAAGSRVGTNTAGKRGLTEAQVHRYELATGKELAAYRGLEGTILHLALSPDGRTLIGLCSDRAGGQSAALAWDVTRGEPLWTWRPKPADKPSTKIPMGPLAIDADGRTAAFVSGRKLGVVVDLATGKVLYELTSQQSQISAIAFDPDGKRIWTAAASDVCAWDRATGRKLSSIKSKTAATRITFAFANGKHRLVSPGPNGLVEYELD